MFSTTSNDRQRLRNLPRERRITPERPFAVAVADVVNSARQENRPHPVTQGARCCELAASCSVELRWTTGRPGARRFKLTRQPEESGLVARPSCKLNANGSSVAAPRQRYRHRGLSGDVEELRIG